MTDPAARVTVITGGGTGIGAATARLLRAREQHVVIAGRRREPLTAVAHDCGALALVADVATPRGVDDLVAGALDAFGRIDGVVLNAGVYKPAEVAELSQGDWEESLAVNLTAPFLLAQAALPSLIQSRGSLVAVSSVAATRTGPGAAAYAAAKAGLEALTRSIAFEHATDGVRANCVSPGWTRTEMCAWEMEQIAQADGVSAARASELATSLVPMRRMAQPEEVAHAIAWLLSDDASYVTGTSLLVDGGTVLGDPGTLPLVSDRTTAPSVGS